MEYNETKKMTCIICPLGCQLQVTRISKPGERLDFAVEGNGCKRGESYAKEELTNPVRTLTCTVQVIGGTRRVISAKSKTPVPRDMQLECMEVIKRTCIKAPIQSGDVIIRDILNTGADIVACEDMETV